MKSKIIINELPMLMVILSIVQICLMLVQVAYSVLVYTETIVSDHLYDGGYIVLLIVAVFVVNLFILRHVLRTLKHSYALIHTQEETIKNIEALNTRIRAQRHDFLNHIQILYGMAELEAYDDLRQYLHKIYGDIETANAFLKTDSIAVNALLQAKSGYAAGRGIAFSTEIGTRLSGTPLSEWDMCRLLGNLIDNALHATADFSGEKQVQIRLTETLDEWLFAVSNSGASIPPQNHGRLFDPGYTTRVNLGEGMGLYIVKTIAEAHHGTVTVSSANDQTSFTVRVPKPNPQRRSHPTIDNDS